MMEDIEAKTAFMVFGHSDRIPIRRVDGPGEAWLELRGSILLFHKQTFIASSTTFIPVEWVRVSDERRRELRHLWRGLLGVTVGVLLALPLWAVEYRMRPHLAYDQWIAAGLGLLLALTLGITLLSFFAFLRPRPIITLAIEGMPYSLAIRFWQEHGTVAVIAGLIGRMKALQRDLAGSGMPPIRMSHLFRRPRPYRMALVKGLGISFLLYILLLFMDAMRVAGYGPEFSRWNYALLSAPPLAYLGAVALRRFSMFREPRSFRMALRCYDKQRLKEAVQHLKTLLSEYPGHGAGRLLIVRALAEQFLIDEALEQCAVLSAGHPVLAAHLESSLWGIRRMRARMDVAE